MHRCCDSVFHAVLRKRGDFARAEFLAALGGALAAAGCSSPGAGGLGNATAIPFAHTMAAGEAETVLYNGTVLTLGGDVKNATAVAIGGGKILAVSSNGAALRAKYPSATAIDLHGMTLAPGFVEAHAHISQVVLNLIASDLGAIQTKAGLFKRLRDLVAALKKDEWLYAQGLDTSLLRPDYRPPTLKELDDVSSTIPIFIEDSTGHLYYVNTAAIAAAGVKLGQKFPAGGLVGGDGDGIEGIVYEFAIDPFLTNVKKLKPGELERAIFNLLRQAQRHGVTTWHDPAAGLFSGSAETDLEHIYQPVAANPTTPVRLMSSVVLTDAQEYGALLRRGRQNPGLGLFYQADDALWIPSLKIWVDGTPQGETAAMTAPYDSTPPTTGFPQGRFDWKKDALQRHIQLAKNNGWSLLMHVNGDAAIDRALDVVEAVFGTVNDTPFRVRFEHCTVSREDQFDRMKSLGINPTFLNNHTYIWGDAFRDRIIGPARANRLDAAGDCVRRKMEFSFHCDYGVSQPEPLRYMQTAVTRRTKQGTLIGADQAISPLEALKGCTIYPARQLGFDHRIGSIEAGKDADFVELAHNPLTVESSAIAGIPVVATWVAGKRLATPLSPP